MHTFWIGFWIVFTTTVVLSGLGLVHFASRYDHPREIDRARAALYQANQTVDEIYLEARISMEEAVGKRRPGEYRIKDFLRASSTDW